MAIIALIRRLCLVQSPVRVVKSVAAGDIARECPYVGHLCDALRIARATLRWDGYLSLDGSGEVVSKPLVFQGSSLAVNARGQVRAELQTPDGKPIPGFSLKECVAAKGDGVSLPVRWKKGDLSRWAGKPVRLRLVTRNASLYSFQFR